MKERMFSSALKRFFLNRMFEKKIEMLCDETHWSAWLIRVVYTCEIINSKTPTVSVCLAGNIAVSKVIISLSVGSMGL